MRQFAFSWMFLSLYQGIEIFNQTHYPFGRVFPKGLTDGLCPIQSDPHGPVLPHCTVVLAWILQISGAEVSRCLRFNTEEVGS